jgi:hypothetical protein
VWKNKQWIKPMNHNADMDDDLRPEYNFSQMQIVARGPGRKAPQVIVPFESHHVAAPFPIAASGREEADRAHLSNMLIFKFGAIDAELEAVIPKLMLLDPFERIQQVMTLSREALLGI